MRRAILFATLPLIALAGCGGSAKQDDRREESAAMPTSVAADMPSPAANAAATRPTTAAPSSAYTPPPAPPAVPGPPPAPLTGQEEKGAKGARAVLDTWARALENHQFGLAWKQFGHPPASQEAYAHWWDRYRTIAVSLGNGQVEGAAGSLYYEVQARLTGIDARGNPYRLEGPVVLRRVNDVDGATPAQLRWHIDQANLKAVPVGTGR